MGVHILGIARKTALDDGFRRRVTVPVRRRDLFGGGGVELWDELDN